MSHNLGVRWLRARLFDPRDVTSGYRISSFGERRADGSGGCGGDGGGSGGGGGATRKLIRKIQPQRITSAGVIHQQGLLHLGFQRLINSSPRRFRMDGEELYRTLSANGRCPRPRPNAGPIPLSGPFFAVLEDALDKIEADDPHIERYVVHKTDEFVVLQDGYPKANVHLLVLPRERVAGIRDLSGVHLPMLRKLAAYTAWVIHGISEMSDLGWACGLHSVPSLRQLHVHVLSRDFNSPCMKNAKHYNSFQAPFLVALDDVVRALQADDNVQTRFALETAEGRLKNQDLLCNRCGQAFGRRFSEFKRHLAACTALPPPAVYPTSWQVSKPVEPLDVAVPLAPLQEVPSLVDEQGSREGSAGRGKRPRDETTPIDAVVDLT
eukprot:TRINITY_DN35628_c0_g1_i1.p1 TRINITY_DN35628_c0_g1~~TRINITY_DN35628_c0_g1_i1.p1  ORF type:complete len:380 (-),score=41.94 TRINITY_DN35628_c0_g1_i1:11-1150(-)